jgi:glycerol kinase
MQIQAELLDSEVVRPKFLETTALGAAFLAGLGAGVWPDQAALIAHWQEDRRFVRTLSESTIAAKKKGWQDAISNL